MSPEIDTVREVVAHAEPASEVASAWRRGIMHVVERIDALGPTEHLNGPKAKAHLAAIREVLDAVVTLQRSHSPHTYRRAFDVCAQDLPEACDRLASSHTPKA